MMVLARNQANAATQHPGLQGIKQFVDRPCDVVNYLDVASGKELAFLATDAATHQSTDSRLQKNLRQLKETATLHLHR